MTTGYTTYQFELGSDRLNRTNVESLVKGCPSPDSVPPHYPIYRIRGDGLEVADGFPQCTWHFNYLSQDDLNTLMAYVATAQPDSPPAALISIKTKEHDGTYQCYQAYMHIPKLYADGKKAIGGWTDIEFKFTHLVAEVC